MRSFCYLVRSVMNELEAFYHDNGLKKLFYFCQITVSFLLMTEPRRHSLSSACIKRLCSAQTVLVSQANAGLENLNKTLLSCWDLLGQTAHFFHIYNYCNVFTAIFSQSGETNVADEQALIQSYTYVAATTNIHPYLSNIVNYAQAVKFSSFDEAEGKHMFVLKRPCLGLKHARMWTPVLLLFLLVYTGASQ